MREKERQQLLRESEQTKAGNPSQDTVGEVRDKQVVVHTFPKRILYIYVSITLMLESRVYDVIGCISLRVLYIPNEGATVMNYVLRDNGVRSYIILSYIILLVTRIQGIHTKDKCPKRF